MSQLRTALYASLLLWWTQGLGGKWLGRSLFQKQWVIPQLLRQGYYLSITKHLSRHSALLVVKQLVDAKSICPQCLSINT